ncbi:MULTISPECIES: hypothetical protein [Bacillus cereus group]|uniref:hypothetical protein n=1 Tax=Bacillus cereus group TaxID=86661 RepID=UPI0011A19A76|nr:hypothetical protein [Bacillus mycoides]
MYEKVDAVLSGNSSDNYFYDDEFMYVQKLISEFTENDWGKLLQNLNISFEEYIPNNWEGYLQRFDEQVLYEYRYWEDNNKNYLVREG